MLDNLDNENVYSQILTRMIANNYVRILVIYYLFIVYGVFGSYSQNSMLSLIKDISALI